MPASYKAQLVELADAVVATLKFAAAADRFVTPIVLANISRRRLPILSLEKISDKPRIIVLIGDDEGQRLDRGGTFRRDYEIHVVLQQKLAEVESEEFDKLSATAEQLLDYFVNERPSGRREKLVTNSYLAVYDQEHLKSNNVFTSAVNLVFQGTRGV